jgi:hypothetical protein
MGDLVLLEAGDRVSADMRLLTAEAIAVDESMLTGESVLSGPTQADLCRPGRLSSRAPVRDSSSPPGVALASPRSPRLQTRFAGRPAR